MITTVEGYNIPLKIKDGLPYINMVKPIEAELDDHPHVTMTSDVEWDPTDLDEDWDPSIIETLESTNPSDIVDFIEIDNGEYAEKFTIHELTAIRMP